MSSFPKFLGIIALFCLISMVATAGILTYFYPQTFTVTDNPELKTYIDGALWSNGSTIDWGSGSPDTYLVTLRVENTGNMNLTVHLIVENLPSGWTETWSGNNTLLTPNSYVEDDLILIVPSAEVPGDYNWNSWITATT